LAPKTDIILPLCIANVTAMIFHNHIFRDTTNSFRHEPSTHLLTRLIGKTTYSPNGIAADDLQVLRTLCNESEKFKVATKLFGQRVRRPRSTSGNYFSLASLLICVCWINWYFFCYFLTIFWPFLEGQSCGPDKFGKIMEACSKIWTNLDQIWWCLSGQKSPTANQTFVCIIRGPGSAQRRPGLFGRVSSEVLLFHFVEGHKTKSRKGTYLYSPTPNHSRDITWVLGPGKSAVA